MVAVADSAAGYAASNLMPADAAVLTVELKVNLLAPASGEQPTAVGQVRRAGRTLTVAEAEVTAWRGDAGGAAARDDDDRARARDPRLSRLSPMSA